jgi:hypothetical protein
VYPGAAAGNDGTVFHLGPSLGISWAGAGVWRPTVPGRPNDPAALVRNLDMLADRVLRLAPADGLAPLVPRLLDDAPLQAFHRKTGSDLVLAALPAVAALQRWIASAMMSGSLLTVPASSLERLIGLGPGLTPSGDDCFIGTLVALRSLGWQRAADVLAAWLLPCARHRTHTISYAHLACAAKGEGAAALHDTLCALCSPDGAGPGALAALESIGHSSGWDALAGLALVTRLHATVLSAGRHDPA